MTQAVLERNTQIGGRELAEEILGNFGYETVCYQTLQRGMKIWFSKRHTGMLGYVESGRHWITAGGPIGSTGLVAEIAEEFECYARKQHRRVCYLCAEEHTTNPLTSRGRGKLIIGAIPIWNAARWPGMIRRHARLRYQLARARRQCADIMEISASHAAASENIRELIRQWMSRRRLMPLRFLADPFILSDAAAHRRIFTVSRRNGQLAGLLAASPVPARNGMFIEQIVRAPHAPNGMVELLIDHAMRTFAPYHRHITLGLVAGSQFACDRENPWWARVARYSAHRWGGWLYRFGSLENFRAALHPEHWEPVYAVSDRSDLTPVDILRACGAMFRFPLFQFGHVKEMPGNWWPQLTSSGGTAFEVTTFS